MALFRPVTRAMVGDGRETLFREDQWIDGARVEDLHRRYMLPSRNAQGLLAGFMMHMHLSRDLGRLVGPNMGFEALRNTYFYGSGWTGLN